MANNDTDKDIATQFRQKVKGTGNAQLDKAAHSLFDGKGLDGNAMADLIEGSMKGVDNETLAQMPGVVVDENTGEARLFGFKVAMPKEMVAAVSALYVGSLKYINDNLGPQTYEAATKGLKSVGASSRAAHAGGVVGELGTIILATHWQDLGSIWGAQRDHKASLVKFSKQVAPVVDELRGKHGVGATMSIKKSENEVLWAERQRQSAGLRLDLMTTAIAASGRATEVVRYIIDRRSGWNQEGTDASKIDGANKATEKKKAEQDKMVSRALESSNARDRLIKEGGMSAEAADQIIQGQYPDLFRGKAKEAGLNALRGNGENAGFLDQMKQVLPTIGTAVSENYAAQYMDRERKKVSSVSAYDMIMTLTSQIDNDPSMKSYDLPDGMKLQDGQRSVSLERYVEELFRRHEADMEPDGKIGKRLEEKLKDASKVIAEALRDGDIDGLTLIALVGERHIVKRGAKSIADKEQARDEVRRQMVKSRRHNTVDEAEYYSERSFTRHDLEEALKSVEGEERMWFASMFPDNVLEGAGMKQEEIKTIRSAATEDIGRHVLKYAKGLQEQGEDFLKGHEATKEEQARITEAAQTAEDDTKALRDLTPKPGKVEGVSHDIAQVLVQHIKHQGKLSDIVKGKIEELPVAVNDNDAIANDNALGDPDMKVDASTTEHEAIASNAHERS